MTSFNLDRFRFDKNAKAPVKQKKEPSPESEKENKPVVTPPSDGRVVFVESSESDDDIVLLSVTPSKKGREGEKEEREKKLLAMFPQLSRNQVLEVVGSTSTLDGAVAACLLRFGDKAGGKKRKLGSSSDVQASKRHKQDVVCIDEEEEPEWDKQEELVRRLQKKFPDQDKEELRAVLREHAWKYSETLKALRMFSEPEITPRKSKMSERDATEDSEDASEKVTPKRRKNYYETRRSEDSESDDSKPGSKLRPRTPQKPQPENKTTNNSNTPARKSNSVQSHFASAAGQAKKAAVERKRQAWASDERVSDVEDPDDDDDVSSEFEDSDEDLELKGKGATDLKEEMLQFFNDSTIDELTLISGCSVKKAQKIQELRPFKTWDRLVGLLQKDRGLSEELLVGCRLVLKERKVVLGLMFKCETISSRLVHQVTRVMRSGTKATRQPHVLNSDFQLKPYQVIGLKWLTLLHEHDLSCILADEMGLGKTIQAIAFLAQLYETGLTGPHLIIVPSSTLDNWVRELKTWCPTFNVLLYYGSAEDRRFLKHDILSGAVDFDVIVTTYNLAYGNDSDRSLFRKLSLVYAVFDEGHMLKNMNSLRYRHLMSINAQHRLLLTGTPLQNNLLELMSLLNFIMPSMFSSSTSQLSKMFSMKSHEEQSKFERDRISQAKRIMKPFILRRVKKDVLKQLPAKEETVEFCPMSSKQKELYQNMFSRLKKSSSTEKREMCNVMMQLRKMANHPLLHRHYYSGDKLEAMSRLMIKEPTHHDADPALIQEDMEVMSDFELHNLCRQYSSISSYQLQTDLLLDSGKFRLLTDLLRTLKDKGDRVVLFSQFTMMLDIVEVFLKHLNHGYVRMDGSTPIADRIGLIDKFNSDPEIFMFLLSTRAGGLGINLTSANVVILHDIDCNPYNDKQAEDRCHRMGQTRTVKVIKLISEDSIEDCILSLGQKKLKLEQDMTTTEDGGEGSIPEDMAALLKAKLGL